MKATYAGVGTFLCIVLVGAAIAVVVDPEGNYKGRELVIGALAVAFVVYKSVKDNEQKKKSYSNNPSV